MLDTFSDWLLLNIRILWGHLGWMFWSTVLALIPLALSGWLFKRSRSRSLLWCLGLFAFVFFLPNAPYVLTDVVHLVYNLRRSSSIGLGSLLLMPLYLLLITVGFESYVLSVMRLGRYLHRWGAGHAVGIVELLTHTFCAIAIYLGRFQYFNQWEMLSQPDIVVSVTVEFLMQRQPLAIIAVSVATIAGLYWVSKQLTLAIAWYWPHRQQISQLEV